MMNAKCISFYYCFLSGFWGPGLHLLFQHHQMALDCSRLLLPLWLPVFYYTTESSTLYRHVFCIGLSLWLSGKITTCKARAAGEASLIPGSGRSSGGGHGNLIQYFCLENPMDRGVSWATVYRVTELDMTERLTHTQNLIMAAGSILSWRLHFTTVS